MLIAQSFAGYGGGIGPVLSDAFFRLRLIIAGLFDRSPESWMVVGGAAVALWWVFRIRR